MQQQAIKGGTGTEKRRHQRVPIAAAAVVHKDSACLGRFWLVNLSVSGALIAGEMSVAVGEKVGLRLELGAHQSVRVRATVVRMSEGSPSPTVGFAFDHDSENDPDTGGARQSIANAVAGALKKDPRQVLIVEDSPVSQRELKFQIRCLGWSCVVVSTPLETIAALAEAERFACIVVGLHDKSEVAEDLLRYLTDAHPRLACLRVSELAPPRPELVKADTGTTLPRPWFSAALARALGIG
jgi:CheY-like chemotaxis protein